MKEDQFIMLFKYMEKRFDSIGKQLSEKATQASLDRLTNTIDGFVKRHSPREFVA